MGTCSPLTCNFNGLLTDKQIFPTAVHVSLMGGDYLPRHGTTPPAEYSPHQANLLVQLKCLPWRMTIWRWLETCFLLCFYIMCMRVCVCVCVCACVSMLLCAIVSKLPSSNLTKQCLVTVLSWLIADYIESLHHVWCRPVLVCSQPILVLWTMMVIFSTREYARNIVVLMIFAIVETMFAAFWNVHLLVECVGDAVVP